MIYFLGVILLVYGAASFATRVAHTFILAVHGDWSRAREEGEMLLILAGFSVVIALAMLARSGGLR